MAEIETGGVAHLPLKFDPAWVVVPLVGGEVCTVLAHDWIVQDDEMVFRVQLAGDAGAALETLRLRVGLVGDGFPVVAGEVPDLVDGDTTVPYVLWGEVNEWLEFEVVGGLGFRVLTCGCQLEGADAAFCVMFQGQREGLTWEELPSPKPWFWRYVLRFPLSLMKGFDLVCQNLGSRYALSDG